MTEQGSKAQDMRLLPVLFLFPRATSQADMLACPFGDCCEGQTPRSLAALQI